MEKEEFLEIHRRIREQYGPALDRLGEGFAGVQDPLAEADRERAEKIQELSDEAKVEWADTLERLGDA